MVASLWDVWCFSCECGFVDDYRNMNVTLEVSRDVDYATKTQWALRYIRFLFGVNCMLSCDVKRTATAFQSVSW